MQVIQATKQPNWAIAFSPCGSWFAAGGGTADVRLWGTDLGAKPTRIPDTRDALGLAFGPDGFLRVSCRMRLPRAFRVPTGEMVGRAEAAFPVSQHTPGCIGFAADGTVVQAANYELGCWDPVAGTLLWRSGRVRCDGLACGPGDLLATTFRGIRKWNRVTGEAVASAVVEQVIGIRGLVFAPDGETLALSAFNKIILWDVPTWTERGRFRVGEPSAFAEPIAYHPAGTALFCNTAGVVRVWNPDTGAERAAFDFGVRDAVSLAVDARGERAALGGRDGRIVVWDLD